MVLGPSRFWNNVHIIQTRIFLKEKDKRFKDKRTKRPVSGEGKMI